MRKRIVPAVQHAPAASGEGWLDLEHVAQVEVTSEESAHPVEAALLPNGGGGWRAAEAGAQTVRLIFDAPQRLRRVRLRFDEAGAERTHEFVLRWSADEGRSFHEVVRQQWTFSPGGATSELEEYRVELSGVTTIELGVVPDIRGGDARASLAELRVG